MKDFTSEGISFCDKKRKKDRLEISNFFFVCLYVWNQWAGCISILGVANFFCRVTDSKYLVFKDYRILGAIIQLCLCSLKAAIDNNYTNGCGYTPIRLYLHKQQQDKFGPRAVFCWILVCGTRYMFRTQCVSEYKP